MSEQLSRTGRFFRGLTLGTGVLVLCGMLGTCALTMVDAARTENEYAAIREAHGGVLPGKEALVLGTEDIVGVQTILHEGRKYTCFTQGRRMGCVKEGPYVEP